jgi:hypothetical protein
MKPNKSTPRLTKAGKRFLDAVTRTKALHALEVLKIEITNHNWLDFTDKQELSKVLQEKIEATKRSNTTLNSSQGYRTARRKFSCVY